MADLTAAYASLQKADAAGDSAGAKQLADFIRQSQARTAAAPAQEAPPDPSAGGGTLSVGPIDTGIQTPQWLDRGLAGAGKALVDIGRGAGQYVGLESRADVARSRELDKPLMATTAGKVGNFMGNTAALAGTMAIPGANTVAGAGMIGAATGALQPSTSTGETIRNTVIGGALGAGSQYVGQKVAQGISNRLSARSSAATAQESQNAVRDSVLEAGQQAGYVVPPTEVNPSATATALESISGKAATKQAAQATNQRVTNSLVAQDLGLPANQPITKDALAAVRTTAGKVYAQVKQAGNIATDSQYLDDLAKMTNVSEEVAKAFPGATTPAADKIDTLVNSLSQDTFSASQAVEYAKRLRQQASANFSLAGRSADPEARALAQAQSQGANALEEMIGRHLETQGNPDLLQQFQAARTQIAKSYQAEAALKGGNVSATRLAAQLQKGKPMSDGFGLIAHFADHFADATKLPKGGVGVSKLAATVGTGGVGYGLLTGNLPLAATSAAGTVAPYAVRSGLLSRAGQAVLAQPSYAPNALVTGLLNGGRTLAPYAYPTALASVQTAQQ